MRCPICGTEMTEMIFSNFCPNNCDKQINQPITPESTTANDVFDELRTQYGTELVNKILQNPSIIYWDRPDDDKVACTQLNSIFNKHYWGAYKSKEEFACKFWHGKYIGLLTEDIYRCRDEDYVTTSIDYNAWLLDMEGEMLYFVETSDGKVHPFDNGTSYWEL